MSFKKTRGLLPSNLWTAPKMNSFQPLRLKTKFDSLYKSCSTHIGASNCKVSAQSELPFVSYALSKTVNLHKPELKHVKSSKFNIYDNNPSINILNQAN